MGRRFYYDARGRFKGHSSDTPELPGWVLGFLVGAFLLKVLFMWLADMFNKVVVYVESYADHRFPYNVVSFVYFYGIIDPIRWLYTSVLKNKWTIYPNLNLIVGVALVILIVFLVCLVCGLLGEYIWSEKFMGCLVIPLVLYVIPLVLAVIWCFCSMVFGWIFAT